MNASLPETSRRGFLTALFKESTGAGTRTELAPVSELQNKTDSVLWAIAGSAPDNIFVAGDDGAVFHFDGSNWKRENLGSKLNVHSLCIRSEQVFSVGWMGRICLREDGQWKPMQGGQNDPATENQPLFDIEAASDNTLWAVGDQGRVCQYDGSQWIEHSSGTAANLRSVLPREDGSVLVGGLGGTVLEFRDSRWRTIDTNTSCPIVSMAPLGEDAIIAVGGEYDIESQRFLGRIFLYRDSNWDTVDVDQPLPRLRRVRREGSSLLITGDGGAAFRWTEKGVSRLPTRLRYDLHDVISFNGLDAIICGDGGTLLQESPHAKQHSPVIAKQEIRWEIISSGETNKTLRSVYAIDADNIVAAGDSGTVLHIYNSEISVTETPGKLRIHALWGSSPRNIFAVCDAATILHFDGNEWSLAHRGSVDTALLAITGFGPHDIFAVGDSGYALRYDGLMWRQIETGIQQELYGLWGQDSQHILAVGGGGVVLRWNGDRWKSFGAGTDQDLYGVHGSGLSKLFIAGLAGTLIRFEDNTWHREFSGVRSDLHAVSGEGDEFYVVGSNGTILRNSDGLWEPEQSGCENTLQAVTATAGAVYAVGSGGMVLRRKSGS